MMDTIQRSIDRRTVARAVAHLFLLIIALIMIGPFVWALLASFKPPEEILTTAANPIPQNPTLHNYIVFWERYPFDRWVMNSVIITVGAVFFSLLLDSLAGFALAKGEFRGKYTAYLLVIGTLVIPPQAIMVPLFLQMDMVGWINTYWGIIVLIVAAPFGTFLMRQYYLSVSDSLIEAARMDGANVWQIYVRIMLPLGKPALASLAIFKFIFMWGAFLWPLIITDTEAMFPLQVGLGLFTGPYGEVQWGILLAASLLTAAPVLVAYAFAQEEFMEGIALSGKKG